MGLAAGGRIVQKIYPDPYGIETWDQSNYGSSTIHIVNSQQWVEITGESPPATPVSARTYTDYGLPWFELYDEDLASLPAAQKLSGVKSIGQIESGQVAPGEEIEPSLEIKPDQVRKIRPPRKAAS
jgi:hypothetical protein